MVIIFPCAGQSSRFPGTRPKYLLTDYSGQLMVQRAASNLAGHKNFVILREHVEKYDAENILNDCFAGTDYSITILEKPTNGPAETVYLALKRLGVNESFLVRDCDSFFDFDPIEGNTIYTSRLADNPRLRNVSQLGYVIKNEQDIVLSVIEKSVVSDTFCVGGYQFENMIDYMNAYEEIKSAKEVFISDIIQFMINQKIIFQSQNVSNYINVGILESWLEYNDRPTIFCDIDGVLVKNQGSLGKNSYDKAQYIPIEQNVARLKECLNRGSQIVFVTARPYKFLSVTKKMLNELGFENCLLIMNLNHARRILVNDFAPSNPYPSATAINIQRNDDNLKDFL
jgi:dTDP-glucose pyrophosphorylase